MVKLKHKKTGKTLTIVKKPKPVPKKPKKVYKKMYT